MNIFAIFLLSSLALGCTEQLEPYRNEESSISGKKIVAGPHIVFSATAEQLEAAKVSLQGHKVIWEKGDEIAIHDSKGNRAVYSALQTGSTTDFVYAYGDKLSDSASYVAYYPTCFENGAMPSEESYSSNTLRGIPMKAVAEGSKTLNFKNQSGIIKVRFTGPFRDICAIVLSCTDTSTFQLTIPEGEGSDISTGHEYLFPAREGNYQTIWLGLLNSKGEITYFSSKGISIQRSAICDLGSAAVYEMKTTSDLSKEETANCYLLTAPGDYRFCATARGNEGSNSKSLEPKFAKQIWSEAGGIRPPILHNGYIYFRKCRSTEQFIPGNSLVAACSKDGKILWSWHIWATGNEGVKELELNAGTMMDRNLGALSAAEGDSLSRGFFYQWGRKDPLRPSGVDVICTSSSTGTSDYATGHPTTFICGDAASGFDWSHEVQDSSRWSPISHAKGIQDPCPPGWRLPDGAGHGVVSAAHGSTPIHCGGFWPKAFGTGVMCFGRNNDLSFFWNGKGIILPASISGTRNWMPGAGYLDPESGRMVSSDRAGSLWTRGCEPVRGQVASGSFCLTFGESGRINPAAISARAAGRNVRCIRTSATKALPAATENAARGDAGLKKSVSSELRNTGDRPESLSPYDLNKPFGWAAQAVGGGIYNLIGGGDASPVILKSTGSDQKDELTSAICNNKVVVLDGSNGDFLIGAGGINLNTSQSKNHTVVGINGATLRQMNTCKEFHSYLDSRAGEMKSHSGGYVKSRNIDIPETSSWYIREGDELYVKGFLIDYYYEVKGIRDKDLLLSEPYKQWGVFRAKGSSGKGTGINLIFRNLTFIGPGSVDLSALDAFCLAGCNNVWVDHCAFYDGMDGNFDITHTDDKGCTNITVSWCVFGYGANSWDHRFSCLISSTDDCTAKITYANCIWGGGIYTRTPLSNASVHQINCMFDAPGPGTRVQNSRTGNPEYYNFLDHCYMCAGEGRSGNNRTYQSSAADSYFKSSDNWFANMEQPLNNIEVSLPYSVQYIPSALVPTVLTAANGAGPTLTDPLIIDK